MLSLLLGAKRVCRPPARHRGLAPKIPSMVAPAVGMEGVKVSLLFAKCLLVCTHAAKRSTCLAACNTHRIPGSQQLCPLVLCQGSETEVTHWLSQTQPRMHSDFPGPEATLPSRAPYFIKKILKSYISGCIGILKHFVWGAWLAQSIEHLTHVHDQVLISGSPD